MNLARRVAWEVAADIDENLGGVASAPDRLFWKHGRRKRAREHALFFHMCARASLSSSNRVGVAFSTVQPCPHAALLENPSVGLNVQLFRATKMKETCKKSSCSVF